MQPQIIKVALEVVEQKEKILKKAEELFMRYGFKSITMDDVSREIGISKKTLYQFFSDKNDLVNQAVDNHLHNDMHACRSAISPEENPILFMLHINEWMGSVNKQINHSVLFDLKKYFKEAWEKIESFRTKFIFNQIKENIENGMTKGLYHKDINPTLIAWFYVQLIDFIIQPETRKDEFGDTQTQHFEIIKYHLRGICTEKGIKILNKKLEEKINKEL